MSLDNEQGFGAPPSNSPDTMQIDNPGEHIINTPEILVIHLHCILDSGGPSNTPQEVGRRTTILQSQHGNIGVSGSEPVPDNQSTHPHGQAK